MPLTRRVGRLAWWVLVGIAACEPAPTGDIADSADTGDTAPPEVPAACEPVDVVEAQWLSEFQLPTRADLKQTVQGVGIGDLDGDGWLDALVAWGGGSFVMQNDGTGNLVFDEAREATAPLPPSSAVALGDLDGDGDLDGMLGSWSGDAWVLWNDGTGALEAESIPDTDDIVYAITLGDLDGDLDLDAYFSVAAIDMTYDDIVSGEQVAGPNLLLVQDADHRFAEKVGALPEDTRYGMTLHTAMLDVEGDGDLDLYVANDAGPYIEPNHLLVNDGRGHFLEDTRCGCDLAILAMGAGVGDADQDGLPDLYVSDVGPPELLLNLGDGTFANGTLTAGDAYIPATSESMVSWGTGFVDLDADMDQDLVVTFGQSGKNFEAAGVEGEDGAWQPSQVLLSDGAGSFDRAEVPGFDDGNRTRAYAVGDLDRDGRPDLVTVGKFFYRDWRTAGGCPPGVTLRLHGPAVVGATLTVEVRGHTQTLWHLPSTTSSSSADEVYVGLGGWADADRILVTWPGGGETVLEHVPAGAVLDLDQP